ncbi:unnamed protein product [Enterobius vermicularis]|uniref:PNP_UDP_1 domain-containing protein n=1 Tax=Enterobius vermicularis TaxID=51028 RepID=A0A0N4VD08_ENTVE|nr:unnamed protein product [Enterobius vermicularis]
MAANAEDGVVPLLNPILAKENEDHLYHFGIKRTTVDLPKTFGDVRFVCCGGSPARLTLYAEKFAKDLGLEVGKNLSQTDRYVLYKTGPVLWISHGIGAASLSIMLVETIKLLHYANAKNVTFIRLGTSGGLGVPPGTVVISNGAVNGEVQEFHIQYIRGKKVLRPAIFDEQLWNDLYNLGKELNMPVATGKTMCADDFYEGQSRLDGAFCDYTEKDKFDFLNELHSKGVRNIEMEATCFSAMTHRAGIKAAIVCTTILDRMKGDQVQVEHSDYLDYEMRPYNLVSEYIKKQTGLGNK